MPVTVDFDPDDLKHYVRVSATGMNTDAELLEILKDVQTAAAQVLELKPPKGTHDYQICLEIEGYAPEAGAYNPNEITQAEANRNDPWCGFCPAFWTKVSARPELQEALDTVLQQYLDTLSKLRDTSVSTPAEADEEQFGEPLLAHLALTDPRFLKTYQHFLFLWDMDHEVEISGAIDQILRSHGWCAETEELLAYCLIDREGFGTDAADLFLRAFEDLNPKMTDTLLFRRYVAMLFRWHLQSGSEALRVHIARLKSGDTEIDRGLQNLLKYRPHFKPGTKAARMEQTIIAELQALQLGTKQTNRRSFANRIRGLFGG